MSSIVRLLSSLTTRNSIIFTRIHEKMNVPRYFRLLQMNNVHKLPSESSQRGFSTEVPFQPGTDGLSQVRRTMKSESRERMKIVFFYNERNPHIGMLGAIRQDLHDHFHLIGSVNDSWSAILHHDVELLQLLRNCCMEMTDASVYEVANILEKLKKMKNVSQYKFRDHINPVIQFRRGVLTTTELAVLEVLAQYAFYNYELID
jgi:hypothetical protein